MVGKLESFGCLNAFAHPYFTDKGPSLIRTFVFLHFVRFNRKWG